MAEQGFEIDQLGIGLLEGESLIRPNIVKNQKSVLILLGLALNLDAAPAQQQTNQAQDKALEMLRQMTSEREKRRAPVPSEPKNAPPKAEPTFAEIERQYLQGKITAKQFQKYLQDHNISVPPKTVPPSDNDALAVEILRREIAKAPAEPAVAPPPVKPAGVKPEAVASPAPRPEPGTTPGPDQTALTEVERKMDELLRLKAAREQAALTNAPAATGTNSSAATAPKTPRQRLDELLKLHIEGKLSEAEYNEKRNKVIAEP